MSGAAAERALVLVLRPLSLAFAMVGLLAPG
jgi:hypothetical protein